MSLVTTWSANDYATISQVSTETPILTQVIAQAPGVITGLNTSSLTNSQVVVNIQSSQVTNSDTSATLYEQYTISLYLSDNNTVGNISVNVAYVQPPSSDNLTELAYVSAQSVLATGCFSGYNAGVGVIQYLSDKSRVLTVYEPN
jgi:hypothetical protein